MTTDPQGVLLGANGQQPKANGYLVMSAASTTAIFMLLVRMCVITTATILRLSVMIMSITTTGLVLYKLNSCEGIFHLATDTFEVLLA